MNKLQLALLFLLLNFCFTLKIHSWTDPTDCEAPTRTISLFFIILFLAFTLTSDCFQAPFPHSYRKWLTYFDKFLLFPMLLFLIIQGLQWGINTMLYQECQTEEVLYGIGIGIICIFGVLYTVQKAITLHYWWLDRYFRELEQNDQISFRILLIFASFNGDIGRQNQLARQLKAFFMKLRLFPSDLEKLKRGKFSQPAEAGQMMISSDLETCSICYEDYCVEEEIVSLPKCKHIFHWECGTRWLLRSPRCPLCRNNVRRALYRVRVHFHQM